MPRIYRGVGICASRLSPFALFTFEPRRNVHRDREIGTKVRPRFLAFSFRRIRHVAINDEIAGFSGAFV